MVLQSRKAAQQPLADAVSVAACRVRLPLGEFQASLSYVKQSQKKN